MTQRDLHRILFIFCVLVTQCVAFTTASSSRLHKDSDDEVFKGFPFDRDYNNTKTQLGENAKRANSPLGKATRRSKRAATNTTLCENRTIELNEKMDLINKTGNATSCNSNPDSCINRCSNQTRFVLSDLKSASFCACDSACNGIFMDCCSDYTKYCGNNTNVKSDPVYLTRSYFHCETRLKLVTHLCQAPAGVWMIDRCPKHWIDSVVREKCQMPPSELNNESYDAFAPVFGRVTQLTYRNQYCALCHNVTQYEFWTLIFDENAIPPADFDKKELMKFLEENGRFFTGLQPQDGTLLRYCYFPTVIKTCPGQSRLAYPKCINGTVEIVLWKRKVYKNRACTSCHEVKSPCAVPRARTRSCASSVNKAGISRAIDLQYYGVSLAVTTICSADQVFVPYLGKCRKRFRSLLHKSSSDSYVVALSLLKYSWTISIVNSSLQHDLAENLKFKKSQVTSVQVVEKRSEFLITFTLQLTPLQSLSQSSDLQDFKSNDTVGLQRLFKFKEAFTLELFDGTNYTVYRITVRRLSCIHSWVYRFEEYTVLHDQRIYVNSTGVIYERHEYELNTTTSEPNVTVCLKLVLFQCNGTYIDLNSSEYHLLPNLTLVYKSLKYGFGKYGFKNGTVSIYVGIKTRHKIPAPNHPKEMIILIKVGFSVSVVCLSALLVTYSIFKQLRTLPGKNLMSLALSLVLVEISRMLGPVFLENRIMCVGIAIANHYFFFVFFTASFVIAFHSCLVFGRSILQRRSDENENRRFIVYLLVIWGVPALFVLTFCFLDEYGVFEIDYGGSEGCWLGTGQSKLFLFVFPFGVLVLFNLSLFVFTAVRLCKNRISNSQFLADDILRQRHRENVVICIKLSTLMGFSWLFVLLHVIFASVTDVFLILFLLFFSLQGVFICVAFLFNHKCRQLYRGLLFKRTSSASNYRLRRDNENGNNCTRDTKL